MLTKAMKISKDGLTIKDIDFQKRTAVIAQATYNSLDREGDRANKGMFTKSWNENRADIRLFKNHNKYSGPGRVDDFWEDDQHAYIKAYMGTHTEGEDTLRQLDEKIIVASSFGFNPVKAPKMANKGYDLKEVQWLETSVLTHWGAHQDSGVVSVQKGYEPEQFKYMGWFDIGDEITPRAGMEHMPEHVGMRMMVIDRYSDFYALRLPDGSTHKWYRGDELKPADGMPMPSMMQDQMKELKSSVALMEKFIGNTKASDECIIQIKKELENTKQLLSEIDTAVHSEPGSSTHEPSASKKDNEFLRQLNYSLLKLNTL